MKKTLKCTCGVESCEYEQGLSVVGIKNTTGFDFVWDMSNGLTPVYLCPSCMTTVRDAWDTIKRIAGTRYVNLACLEPKTTTT